MLVFIVLLFEFGNFGAPMAILASALLSTSGVFLALLVTGITFNISSFMGLIMVIGIVAKNGILLLDADQKDPLWRMPAEEGTDTGRRTPSASDHDDRDGHGGRDDPAVAGVGCGLADATAAGGCGDRGRDGIYGVISGGHANGRKVRYSAMAGGGS